MNKFYKSTVIGFAAFLASTLICHGQSRGMVDVERESPAGIVSFSPSSTLTGISDTKHVDGYVKKYGSALFVFPVGDGGSYRPFAAEADGTFGAYFKTNPGSATLPSGAPFAVTQKESDIKTVSNKEYWDVNGNVSTRLSFSWNAASDIGSLTGDSLQRLCIVGWNNASLQWEKITSAIDEVAIAGGGSTLTKGSITTIEKIVPNNYRAYTLASLNVAAVSVDYAGALEMADCSQLKGWAWDKNHPNAALTLELIVGGTVYATFVADDYRSDLKNNGTGTGNYGFNVPLPMALMNGQPQQVSVRVRNASFVLSGSPRTVDCSYGGEFEVADCNTITGWIQDKNNPGSALTVELLEGNTIHATAIASINRTDLPGVGTGNYGFSINTPLSLKDGKARDLRIRIKGTTYILPTVKNLVCAATQLDGYFYASCSTLWGWAWDKKYPNTALTIEIYEGTNIIATVLANNFRQDLKDTGFGTGNYGYSIPLPASLKDAQAHQLSARVKGNSFVLRNSPQTLTCAVPSLYAGALESADCSFIKGYAWDKSYPDTVLTVELMEGTKVLATTVANTYRADLKDAGIGTGKYGFSFALPSSLRNAQPHQLSVRIKGTSTILSGSPKSVTCAVPSVYEGYSYSSCSKLWGWVWDQKYPNAALTVEIFEGSTIHATVIANTNRPDLPFGTGNYGYSIPLPASLKDNKVHQLSARVKGTNFLLKNSPQTLSCVLPSIFAGALESADCSFIKGYAWDKNYPDSAMTVELMEGTTVLATAVANIYRADLKDTGIGTGKYGFSIALPSALRNGAAHSLSVRIKGTTTVLSDSPKSVTCSLPTVYGGGFDYASCATLKGWAWDKNYPDKALTVEIYEGSTVYATVVANLYRADIKTKGYGTGIYGFEIPLPATLKDGIAHALSVRVKGSTYILPASPRSVTCTLPASYAGALESADCSLIKGFAWDKNHTDKALTVELMEGSTILATVVANTYRADLKDAGTGTGLYGFSIATPSVLRDGNAHALSVRIKGTTASLSGSPKSVTCSLPTVYGGGFDYASCATLKGWAWDKNYPDKALTVEIYEGSTVYATVVANLYRADIKTKGYGTGIYGFEIPLPATLKDGIAHALSVRVKGSTYILPASPRSVTCTLPVSYAGALESADCSLIKGFAWDKNHTDKALTVELMEGSTILATVVANTYRADLKDAGTGTGLYGFSIATPSVLRDGNAHALSVRIKGTTASLSGSPKSVTCSLPTVYGGGFDYLSCATIKGWAWDKNYPEKTLTIEMFEGSTVFGSVTASLYREDIKNKGYGTGNYGFNLATPASLKDGNTHSVSLRVKGTSYVIPGSPRVVTCASSARIAAIDEIENAEVKPKQNWEIIIAPNPTQGRISVNFQLNKGEPATLMITDILGRNVWQKATSGSGENMQELIDLSQNGDGIYLFTIKSGGNVETKRIVLTK